MRVCAPRTDLQRWVFSCPWLLLPSHSLSIPPVWELGCGDGLGPAGSWLWGVAIFLFVCPVWCSLSFLDLWFGVINLENSKPLLLLIVLCPFLSFSSIPITCMLYLCKMSMVLRFCSIFLICFLFAFQFLKSLLNIFKLTDSFLGCVQTAHQRNSSFILQSFWFPAFLFAS